jgi:hypothetical protein
MSIAGTTCYPGLLTKKKLRYPVDLVALLDRDGACFARVQWARDGFSIMTVRSDGNKLTISWDEDNERIARQRYLQMRARFRSSR